MSREVCGICWCPYDEDTGECACAPQSLPAQEPIAWYHVPYPNNGAAPMVSLSQQREPSMYGATVPLYLGAPHCTNCASLQDQNTELDRKLAEMERKPLTEEEIERLLSKHERDYDMVRFARAVERAHGIT